MVYAVSAVGIERITDDWRDVEQIRKLYPYPQWRKCATAEQAENWLKSLHKSTLVKVLYNYGRTIPEYTVHASYRIGKNCVYYKVDTRDVGYMFLQTRNVPYLIELEDTVYRIKDENANFSDTTIRGHMAALKGLLSIVGDYVDLNIYVENYCIFYCLTQYDKNRNVDVASLRGLLRSREGAVAYTYGLL